MSLLDLSKNVSIAIVALCSDMQLLEVLHHTTFDVKCYCINREELPFTVVGEIRRMWTEAKMTDVAGIMAGVIDKILGGSPGQDIVYVREGTSTQ